MKIKEIFEKDINRDINGVIKADQTDDQSKWTELDEYVITKEVDDHLREFFSRYIEAIENPKNPSIVNKVGVGLLVSLAQVNLTLLRYCLICLKINLL